MSSTSVEYPPDCKPVNVNCSNTELLKRLKILSEALKNEIANKENGIPNRFTDLMLHLTKSQFISNKNKDNLSRVETMQLALRLDDDAYIILHNLIKKSFNSMNEKNADEHIQGMMVGMCSKLIQKVDQISNIILDAIFFFIVQPQKINNRESYRMARDLIRTNQMTLEPYIAVLLKRGLETGVLDDCELISRKKLFDLICELGRFAPEIISSVFPSLIKQLHSDVVTARREAARLFGSLFGDQNSHLAEDEPDVWDKYMKRFADVDTEIRRICVKDAENILVFHPGLRGEVTDAVILRSQDVDENVRLEVITMVQRLTKRKFEAISERLLTHVIDRIRDKKAKIVLINMIRVRHTAIRGLSQLHRTVFTDDSLTVLERSSVSSIFSSIMNHYFQPIPGDRFLTEKIFVSNLIPYKINESTRMEILINIFLTMNTFGMRALEQILAKQSFQKRLLHDLVVLIDLNDNGQKSEAIDDIVKRIVECNPDPAKFSLSFRHFMTALSNDKQMMLFMKYITGDDYTCKKVEAAVFEILQRLQKHKVSSECIDSIKCLFECCSPLQFDQIAVSFLIHRVVALIKTSVDSNELSQYSKLIKLLKIVADAYAHCFVNQCALENLVKLMDIENFPGIEDFLSLTITISAELRKSEFLDKNIVATFVKYCESIVFDCSPRAAKYAVRCISKLLDTERARVILGNIFQKTVLRVSTSNPNCCTALETLNACVEVNPMQFCSELHEILKSKVMEILFDIEDCGNDIDQDSSEQLNDEVALNNNYVKIKKQCLKFIAKFLVSVANFSTCDVDPAAKHILQFYSSLLKNKGNIFKKQCGQNHMAELRLVAGNSMLKLATKPRYAKFFSISDFLSLSTLAYDQVCEIRRRFFAKLNKHLITLHLHVEYMGLFALVGLDDDEGFKNKIRVFINANITKRRKYMERWSTEGVALCYQPEYCLAYAVYVLSKLPTFESIECESELRRLSKCIWFLLDVFNTRKEPGSMEFIYNIFLTMKNCTDAEVQSCLKKESGQKNEKIWSLCDLGILLISYQMQILIKEVDCKIQLSKKFFTILKGSNNVVYLPSSILDEFKAKKKNLKQIQAEVEWKGTKLPVDHEHCGTGKSMVKALFGSERTICEERGGRPSCISQVNDIILKEESCSSNPKRSKPGTRRRKARVSACRNIKVRKETKKRSTLRRSSNTKTEPEPSKLNFDKESAAEIRDSLENCKCSPIRSNFLHQSLFSEESHILSRQQPFLSSTPLSKAEKRAAAQVNENKNNTSEVEKGNEVALRGEKGIDSANKAKVGKIKRCGVRKTKVSKQTANLGIELKTSGVATRLRSRQKLTLSSVPVALKSRNR